MAVLFCITTVVRALDKSSVPQLFFHALHAGVLGLAKAAVKGVCIHDLHICLTDASRHCFVATTQEAEVQLLIF